MVKKNNHANNNTAAFSSHVSGARNIAKHLGPGTQGTQGTQGTSYIPIKILLITVRPRLQRHKEESDRRLRLRNRRTGSTSEIQPCQDFSHPAPRNGKLHCGNPRNSAIGPRRLAVPSTGQRNEDCLSQVVLSEWHVNAYAYVRVIILRNVKTSIWRIDGRGK